MSKVEYAICISLYMPYVMSDTVLYTFQLIFSVYIKDVCYIYILIIDIDIHIIVIYVILHMSFFRDVSACQTASQTLFISALPRSFHGFLMYIIY